MPRKEKLQGFWTTLPGILTGGAALLTAVTGLIVGLYQYGAFGSKSTSPGEPAKAETPSLGTAPTASQPPVEAAPQPAATGSRPQPTPEATVAITANDGTTTNVLADSFRQIAQYDQSLHLLSGQAVAFAKIKAIEVVRHYEDKARIQITLLDGRVLEDALASGSSIMGFHGESDLGTIDIRMEQLPRIVFRR